MPATRRVTAARRSPVTKERPGHDPTKDNELRPPESVGIIHILFFCPLPSPVLMQRLQFVPLAAGTNKAVGPVKFIVFIKWPYHPIIGWSKRAHAPTHTHTHTQMDILREFSKGDCHCLDPGTLAVLAGQRSKKALTSAGT